MGKQQNSSRLRISILSAFFPFRGGIAQFNARLFRELERTSKPQAFTFKTQYPDFLFPGKTQLVQPDDRVDHIPAERIVSPFNPLTWISAARKIKNSNPDLFVTNYWMTFFGPCFGFLSARQKKEVVKIGLIHNLIPHEPRFFDKWFTKYYLQRHDGFVVLSEAVEKDLIRIKPKAKFIRLFHPWYDHFGLKEDRTNACRKLGLDDSKINLIFFGLIRDYKGLDLLLEAFKNLPANYQLVIAGEVYGDDRKYRDQIATSPASDRIVFHDRYISDEEVAVYFSAADVCVLPYRSATQSGITAVAFHFDVPVVVTDVGDLKNTVESVGGGIAVDVSAESLEKGILKISDQALLSEFRVNIAQAKEKYSWESFTYGFVSFVSSIRH